MSGPMPPPDLLPESSPTSTQTVWPDFMAELEPAPSESTVAAAPPADVVVLAPDGALPPSKTRWSGRWSGWVGAYRLGDIKLAVEELSDQGATLVYAIGSAAHGAFSERLQARFSADELQGTLADGRELSLRIREGGVLDFLLTRNKAMTLAGVLSKDGSGPPRLVERIPTPFVENGKPVTLEVVIFKPPGPGPFPLLMVNHGSTGNGDNPALFTSTWTSHTLVKVFTDKGWLVAFPQRRGRGKSDGLYDEGFTRGRSEYACQPELSLPGVERALADTDAAAEYLLAKPDVDSRRALISGVSRGGILAVAYAGTHPTRFQGVINFVGGWMGAVCRFAEAINAPSFQRGAPFPRPMLWLYGENDRFYSIDHSRKNFDAFVAAGGSGSFNTYSLGAGQNGHMLHTRPDLWRETMNAYLDQLGRR